MTSIAADLSYVAQVASDIPTREHEAELARRLRDRGDQGAADALVRSQLRMVVRMAMKFRHYGVPVADLVAEGNCGLTVALHRFDPERGIRFGTYAKHWVRAHIIACVIRSINIVGGRSGLLRAQDFFRLRRERARVTALYGDGHAAVEALAARMDVSVGRLHDLLSRLDSKSFSLDDHPHSGIEDFVDAGAAPATPEDSYCRQQRHEVARVAVATALGALDPRERLIAEHRLMAAPSDELSLSEVAERLGISRERARQLETRAKQKLKRSPAIRHNPVINEWFARGPAADPQPYGAQGA